MRHHKRHGELPTFGVPSQLVRAERDRQVSHLHGPGQGTSGVLQDQPSR